MKSRISNKSFSPYIGHSIILQTGQRMSFEVSGKLHVKNDTVQVTDRFSKREFVLEIEDGMYPQHIKFQLTQDRVSLLDAFEVSDMLHVSFNLKGREYTNPQGEVSYFTNLNAWRIQKVSDQQQPDTPPPASKPASTGSFPSAADEPVGEFNDLPF